MTTETLPTSHAVYRQAQRNLSDRDVQFVLAHGRLIRCAGAMHVFLGRRDIPGDRETQREFGRLEGTVLVLTRYREKQHRPLLITAYRNRRGLKQIRSKAKYDRYRSAA